MTAVKSADCSLRRHEFNLLYPHGSSQPSATVTLEGSDAHFWPPEALHTSDASKFMEAENLHTKNFK